MLRNSSHRDPCGISKPGLVKMPDNKCYMGISPGRSFLGCLGRMGDVRSINFVLEGNFLNCVLELNSLNLVLEKILLGTVEEGSILV